MIRRRRGRNYFAITTGDLIEKLKEMKAAAKRGHNMTATTELFGIIFDEYICASGATSAEIGIRKGISSEEISDGGKLAR